MEDALGRLVELGMLEEEEAETLGMHRLLAAFVRDVVAGEEVRAAVEAALASIVFPLLERGYPAPLLDLLPHLRAVTDDTREREDRQAALLCHQLGLCLRMVGAYQEARRYWERDLEITERMLGEEHPETAGSLNNLATLLRDQGDYEGAKPLYGRALEIRKKVLGEEHPETATSLNNLGALLSDQRDYKQARLLVERALEIYEKVLGEEHPYTRLVRRNLANLES